MKVKKESQEKQEEKITVYMYIAENMIRVNCRGIGIFMD